MGASNLPAAAYQATSQLRIPMTAALSRVVLGKHITRSHAAAVFILMGGVILVLIRPDAPGIDARERRPLVGVAAVLASCLCSTFASVWFERVIKHGASEDEDRPLSLWSANLLLAGSGLPLACATAFVYDGDRLSAKGVFFGFDALVTLALASVGKDRHPRRWDVRAARPARGCETSGALTQDTGWYRTLAR